MSATSDSQTDWQQEAARLRRDERMATAEIAERFGKSASQVRRVLAQANTQRAINGADYTDAAVGEPEFTDTIPGQTTVEEYLTGVEPDPIDECDKCGQAAALTYLPEYGANFCETCAADPQATGPLDEVPAQDDPEHTADPLDDFRSEAGDAVGPMPPDPSPPEPGQYEVRLAGTRQMALDFGENASLPTGATIVLKSEKRASGFYGLGDVFSGTFTARVTKTPGEEKFDKDMGEYMAKDIAYQATITEFSIDVSPSG